ncbi:aldo/keto reductase [Erythrobacter sp. HKB08]|uniref:aldo/keto reductase n=1 Tax=Erythrobacter sp. HKB08 TaxID=2502843 RepID=UPI001008E4E6|nr:aldo/keto reductase [Erythrobacter sp. HKB08]
MSETKNYPTLPLNDDRQIPQLGFGTWEIDQDDAAEAVRTAIDAGYWLIDTAAIYQNERGVGEGIGDWSDIFLQTKIWNESQGYDRTLKAADKCLERLGRDHVDMLLIHWPCPEKGLYVDTWKALIELRDQGKAKSIGVSNFREEDLKRIVDDTGVVPALNQIELHPTFQQREMRRVHDEMGIVTQSWSPLGQGNAMGSDAVKSIAEETGQSPAAVVIRWHIQHGLSTLPRSTNPDHIRDNFSAVDFELTTEQMAKIDALDDPDGRIGPEPGKFNS